MIPILHVGNLQIPTFFFVISISLSALLFYLSYRVDQFHRNRRIAFNLSLILMIGGFIGARLLHVFYEEWNYYAQDPVRIFYFWQGGFVYYGGFLVAWPAAWLYARLKKVSFLEWADFFAPLLSLSHALGRVGCILTGCCFGEYCDLPWAVVGRHPTASYLLVGELLIFGFLLFAEMKLKPRPGQLFFKWIFLHSTLRYVVEFFRADFRGEFINVFGLGAISVSQAVCLLLMFISLGYFVNIQIQSRKN